MKLYNNKRQLKTLIRKYKKLNDKKEIDIMKDKQIQESIQMLIAINAKQTNVIKLCDEIISSRTRNIELKQFATRIKHNI